MDNPEVPINGFSSTSQMPTSPAFPRLRITQSNVAGIMAGLPECYYLPCYAVFPSSITGSKARQKPMQAF
jgi:hypothetical protein